MLLESGGFSELVTTTGVAAAGWRVVAETSDHVVFVALAANGETATAAYRRSGEEWVFAQSGVGGVVPDLPIELTSTSAVAWVPQFVSGGEIELLAVPRECRSGASLKVEDVQAVYWHMDTRIALVLSESVDPHGECQGRPESIVHVRIVGAEVSDADRLVDGATVPPEEPSMSTAGG